MSRNLFIGHPAFLVWGIIILLITWARCIFCGEISAVAQAISLCTNLLVFALLIGGVAGIPSISEQSKRTGAHLLAFTLVIMLAGRTANMLTPTYSVEGGEAYYLAYGLTVALLTGCVAYVLARSERRSPRQ